MRRVGIATASPQDRAERARISEVEQFFAEDDRPGLAYPMLAFVLSFAAIVTAGTWILLFLLIPDDIPKDYPLLGTTAEKAVGLLGFLSAFFVSLVASVLAVAMINRVNLGKIKFIKNLTQTEAVKTVLTNLNSYGGRYSESKHVELVFENLKVGLDGFAAIKVTQTVRLRMPMQRKGLILDFVKLDRSIGPEANSVTYDLQRDDVPDDAQSIDVTDMKRCFPDDHESMFPGVVEVIVDSQPQNIVPEFVDNRRNHLRWRLDTKRYLGRGLVDVVYRYSYYQEATGFAYQEVSEPTHGFLCSLNYEGVADDISVYRIGTLNARVSGQDVANRAHQLEVSTSEWVVPKSLIVFCWYQKDIPKTDQSPKVREVAGEPSGEVVRDGLVAAEAAGLKVDGNCLGVALFDTLATLQAACAVPDFQELSTPADAIGALRGIEDVDIALSAPGRGFARLPFRLQAWRFGIPVADDAQLAVGEIALCMRSMRQLYGLKRAEAHWVIVKRTAEGLVLTDRLAQSVRQTFVGAQELSAQKVLDAAGFTLKVWKR